MSVFRSDSVTNFIGIGLVDWLLFSNAVSSKSEEAVTSQEINIGETKMKTDATGDLVKAMSTSGRFLIMCEGLAF